MNTTLFNKWLNQPATPNTFNKWLNQPVAPNNPITRRQCMTPGEINIARQAFQGGFDAGLKTAKDTIKALLVSTP